MSTLLSPITVISPKGFEARITGDLSAEYVESDRKILFHAESKIIGDVHEISIAPDAFEKWDDGVNISLEEQTCVRKNFCEAMSSKSIEVRIKPFEVSLPTANGEIKIDIDLGTSAIFVGANGGGKTRMAAHIENVFNLHAHRISAHRALTLNPSVAKISEKLALAGLRTGNSHANAGIQNRLGSRWHRKQSVALLNDFDFLIQALFADQANQSLKSHSQMRSGNFSSVNPTKFERLASIWERLLPHRRILITGDDIRVSVPGLAGDYDAAEMSDGERAIFYMIGQTLVAAEVSLLIFDEPELHVHRSILAKLWDELETARPDCGFVLITHDLEFAASRIGKKFIIREYKSTPQWAIEELATDAGFSEEITTLILGSRRPILFVEGDGDSLDRAIYRCCFSEWTVIPVGSCENVIHSVVTMRRNNNLTRITCSGAVDADDYEGNDVDLLQDLGIVVLPVSEIENIFLLPSVARTIASNEGFIGSELDSQLEKMNAEVFDTLRSDTTIEEVVARYCKRRIDRYLKKVDLGNAKSISDIKNSYDAKTSALEPPRVYRRLFGLSHAAWRSELMG